ncbi:SPOR domain-containing protein [Ostreibacterium oceani]|uniref:SPOR domain-containing protein n=1 Tax=Ostreibacterium oceani TaxID=2654998 RepID=UPI001C407F14|nr:SPOR domain-containing protein [Ostreibacterium oceani]
MKKHARIKFLGMFTLVLTMAGVLLSIAGQLDFIGQSRVEMTQHNTNQRRTDDEPPKYSFYQALKARKVELERAQQAQENTASETTPVNQTSESQSDDKYRYVVQVGAFNQQSDADKVKAQVERLGLPARVVKRGTKYLTQAGPFAGKQKAQTIEATLKSQKFPTLIKRLN